MRNAMSFEIASRLKGFQFSSAKFAHEEISNFPFNSGTQIEAWQMEEKVQYREHKIYRQPCLWPSQKF